MMDTLRRFEFPERISVTDGLIIEAPALDEAEIKAAITRSYGEGLQRGRQNAVEELEQALSTAHVQGREAGRREGLAETQIIADTLRAVLAAVEQTAASFAAEAEHFCVALTLAAIGKLAEVDPFQTDFIKQSIRRALTTLAPHPPIAILVNPDAADRIKLLFPDLPIRADAQIGAGQVRIDGGRFLIEATMEEALGEIRDAIIAVRTRRTESLKHV